MNALERTVDRDAKFPKAKQRLLELYVQVNKNNNALDLANDLIEQNEKDVLAWRAKATALGRLGQHKEALNAAKKALELDPEHWETRMLAFQLRSELGEPADQLIKEAEQLLEKHPKDPRYELLLGYAHMRANHVPKAIEYFRSAASRTPPNEKFLITLVHFLDGASLYPEARQVLAKHVDRDSRDTLYHEMILRLFESGNMVEVADRLKDVDVNALAKADDLDNEHIQFAALRAAALYRLGRSDEANAIVKALASQTKQPLADAWSSVLKAMYQSDQSGGWEIRKAANTALETFPNNALFYGFRASAYAQAGDLELALADWKKAAQLRPPWSVPHTRMAELLLRRGKANEAADQAMAGVVRRPDGVEAAATLAKARAQTLSPHNSNQVEQLLDLIRRIRDRDPGNAEMLYLHVNVLARAGQKDAAASVLRQALQSDVTWSQSTLTALAALSKQYDLGTAKTAQQRIESQYSATADSALAQALTLAQQGKPEQGLALIENKIKEHQQAPDSADDQSKKKLLPWQLARAEYLARTKDPRAAEAWIELADAQTHNPKIQQRALQVKGMGEAHREFAGTRGGAPPRDSGRAKPDLAHRACAFSFAGTVRTTSAGGSRQPSGTGGLSKPRPH